MGKLHSRGRGGYQTPQPASTTNQDLTDTARSDKVFGAVVSRRDFRKSNGPRNWNLLEPLLQRQTQTISLKKRVSLTGAKLYLKRLLLSTPLCVQCLDSGKVAASSQEWDTRKRASNAKSGWSVCRQLPATPDTSRSDCIS